MLQKIGDAFTNQRWLAYILFGALSVIFAAWGAYGIATIQFTTGDNAAKVNGVTIPYSEVRNAWMQQQAAWEQRVGGTMPRAVQTRLENQLLEEYIRDTLLAVRTRKLGYRIGDGQLAEAIRQDPAFQIEGKYSAAVAKLRLQQAGVSEQDYEQDLRQSLRIGQLEGGISDSQFLTPTEVQRIEALKSEEREVQYAVVAPAKFASAAPIDAEAVQGYYAAHRAAFMTPEYVHVQYAELDLSQILAQTQVADQDLKAYYDKHKAEFVVPERRRARHILIAVNAHRTDAEALKRADDVLAKLKAGASFAALAKQYSDDTGSASQGGDLGWADRSAFVGPFANAVFSMKVGEIRGPVKSQYGYHIVELEGIEPGKTRTLAQVRAQIEPIVRQSEATNQFGDVQEQIQEQLDEGAPSLTGLAKTFHMKLGEVAEFVRGKGGAPLGDSRELEGAVFGDSVLDEHRIGGPVLIGNDRMVLVSDLDHRMPSAKPLAEVRDTIVATLRKQQADAGALLAAQSAVRELESGKPFDGVAQRLGANAEPPRFVGRDDPSVPTEIRNAIFASARPEQGKPVYRSVALASGGAAVIAVMDVKLGTALNPGLEQSTLRQAMQNAGTESANAYMAEARLTAKVKKNLSVFD
ncbi:MAG: peptidylprolyl isomerase [Steroidobacteraceae bacterium]